MVAAIVCACVTIVILAFGLRVSFDTEGGVHGQTPVLAYALAVALAATSALMLFAGARPGWSFPWWGHVAGFLAALVVTGTLLKIAGSLGARVHAGRRSRPGGAA